MKLYKIRKIIDGKEKFWNGGRFTNQGKFYTRKHHIGMSNLTDIEYFDKDGKKITRLREMWKAEKRRVLNPALKGAEIVEYSVQECGTEPLLDYLEEVKYDTKIW